MREADLERLLTQELARLGGVGIKLDARSRRGVPDRVVVLNGRVVFVELKTEAGIVAPLQRHEHDRIRAAGGEVVVIRGADEVRRFCRGI